MTILIFGDANHKTNPLSTMHNLSETAQFDADVIEALAEIEDIARGDAQDIFEAADFAYMQCLTRGISARDTAEVILHHKYAN